MPRSQKIYARIAPERIHFLKFVLEGYDGLAILSTSDEKQGVVRLMFSAENKAEIVALLDDLEPQLAGGNRDPSCFLTGSPPRTGEYNNTLL